MTNRPVVVPPSVLRTLRAISTFDELWACYRTVLDYNGLKLSQIVNRCDADAIPVPVRQALMKAQIEKDNPYISTRAFTALLKATNISEVMPWTRAYAGIESTSPALNISRQQVLVAGQNAQVNVSYGQPAATADPAAVPRGEMQAHYYFRFLGQSLTQATVTFVLSMLVAAAGMAIVLIGAALAVIRANANASTVIPVLTSVAGLAVTTCGGLMAVQANKARAHASELAENVRRDMNSDQAFDRATTLISKVDDPTLRDRLFAITAVNEMGLSPKPLDLAQHLALRTLPGPPTENPDIPNEFAR